MKTSNNNLRIIAGYIVREMRTVTGSYAILLVMLGGILIYGLLYNYMYAPNLVRNVPVVVVDCSMSPLSREYISLLDASPQVDVVGHAPDMPAAERLMAERVTEGVVFIPADFSQRLGRGEQAAFVAMGSTSALLNYAAIEEAAALSMAEIDSRHRSEMAVFMPLTTLYAMSEAQIITVEGTPLYNPTEGYGSYLIPAVLIIILFQTLMMVIGMISGGERRSGTIAFYAEHGTGFGSAARAVVAKTFTYSAIYALFALFLTGFLPQIFSIPHIGDGFAIVAMMIPFLLATCFFGLSCSIFFTDSDSPILMIAFFSIGLIFLSGISFPLELMPWYWQAAHYLIPAQPAVLAFVKIGSMGASMADVRPEYVTMWIQCAVYFVTACLAYRHNIKRASRS